MSVVLVSAMKDFIIFMSDGKVTRPENGAIKSLDENYKKLRRINNNICIGYTGGQDICENVLTSLDSYDKKKLDLTKTVDILHKFSKEIYSKNKYQNNTITMVIGGKSADGTIEFYTFGSYYDFQLNSYKPQDKKMLYRILCSDEVKGLNIFEKHLNLHLNESLKPIKECQDAMSDCVDEIASDDETVNNTKFTEIIITDI